MLSCCGLASVGDPPVQRVRPEFLSCMNAASEQHVVVIGCAVHPVYHLLDLPTGATHHLLATY
jgi:hypothetical protein